jgi:hypothetical protein
MATIRLSECNFPLIAKLVGCVESLCDRENNAHEQEKLLLRLENTLLKFERRLISGDTSLKKPDEE